MATCYGCTKKNKNYAVIRKVLKSEKLPHSEFENRFLENKRKNYQLEGGYGQQNPKLHMAGSSQPQHFFAAECLFTDFEAMITDTV